MPEPVFRIDRLSEYAISIQFGNTISETTLQRITSFSRLLQEKPFVGFITAVPAYVTLSVFYDPVQVIANAALPGSSCFEKVSNYLSTVYQQIQIQPVEKKESIIIPVCYGGDYGPDIDEVASVNKLTPAEVIALHSDKSYDVFIIGFVPGFAYLGGMNERLTTPRKTSPRQKVLAGSVGIAGSQTGIYSLNTPGGWQIIGRTPFTMFDANNAEPSLLKAGDQVVFKPIDAAEYERLSRKQYADNN